MAAPPEVRAILQRRCYACHSDQPRLAWFDQIAPAYWLVAYDVRLARGSLNFSEMGNEPEAQQRAELFDAVNEIQFGSMPLPRYLAVHRDGIVTADEMATLKAYLAPFAPQNGPKSGSGGNALQPATTGVARNGEPAGLSLNGVPYLPDYKNWKVISTTDRGDNNSLHLITGNDIAVRAIAQRQTNPWPDGTAFAKVAFQSVDDGRGHITPGDFMQVEFMEKEHVKYSQTGGWGFARWRGADLKPFGKDAHFDGDCLSCHWPMQKNDFVFTLPITRDNQTGGGR
jgi:Cytochrome P460/Haem-binding domain